MLRDLEYMYKIICEIGQCDTNEDTNKLSEIEAHLKEMIRQEKERKLRQ